MAEGEETLIVRKTKDLHCIVEEEIDWQNKKTPDDDEAVQIKATNNRTNEALLDTGFLEDSVNSEVSDDNGSKSNSDSDSDYEYFDYKQHNQTITTIANSIRFDFIQNITKDVKKKRDSLTFKPLNSFISLSKPYKMEEDCELEKSTSDSTTSSSRKSLLFSRIANNAKDYKISPSSSSKWLSADGTETKRKEKRGKKANKGENKSIEEKKGKKANKEENESIEEKEKMEPHCLNPTSRKKLIKLHQPEAYPTNSLKRRVCRPIALPDSDDFPKNALVLYWGRINMTVKEIQHLNVSRCIKALLEEDHFDFVLLKIQQTKFTLQYCDSSKGEEEKAKPVNEKRKNSISEIFFHKERRPSAMAEQSRKGKKKQQDGGSNKNAFFSCINFSTHTASRYQHLARHNDSLCLKSYEVMKRKKLLEFDYKKIVYCGVEEKNIPNNMLLWIYHSEHGTYSAVECHCVECDDQSHARQLSRGLWAEITRATNSSK